MLRPKTKTKKEDSQSRMKTKKRTFKYVLPKDTKIEYRNLPLLQKYVTDRGKMISRRVTGVTAKQQRDLTTSIKLARYLGLLPVSGIKR